ncbi:AAA family ATPase [Frateuria sp. GZRR35]|uniref:AAA family ATPase n=1 Tax=Frateuria sp. GZRR35 TaxID=3351536 RepID=UPI003EDB81D7
MEDQKELMSQTGRLKSVERLRGVRIIKIRILKLFGSYDYNITIPAGTPGRAPIFYGENGLGKTNILKIIFHLLSPAGNGGHRSALGKIKFQSVEILLSNSTVVSAERKEGRLDGLLQLRVFRDASGVRQLIGGWDWSPRETAQSESVRDWLKDISPAQLASASNSNTRAAREIFLRAWMDVVNKEADPLMREEAFLSALRENVPPIYFMTAERTLSSDFVSRDQVYAPENARLRPEEMVSKGRERSLSRAITLASQHLSYLSFEATRQGSRSAHSIYQELIKNMAAASQEGGRDKAVKSTAEIEKLLLHLSEAFTEYEKYGLAPRIDGESLVAAVRGVPSNRALAIRKVLDTYVDSLDRQAKSIGKAYAAINTLLCTVNDFLFEKTINFSPANGLNVTDLKGDILEPSDLSSGEQQLLLLFCHITIAHDSGGIFIIDEPEISLNIKWQRRLVDALLQLDSAANLQFVMASHSIELLTKHRDSVVVLNEAVN